MTRMGQVAIHLHSSKENNYDLGIECGLKGEALKMFMFALYEIKVECDLNMDTGEVTILKVNGRKLEEAR